MPDDSGDYDWLFDASASRRGADPVVSQPKASPKPKQVPPPDLPPPNLPPPGRRRASPIDRPPRWRRRVLIGAAIVPAVWVAYLAVVPMMAWSSVATTEAWPTTGTRPAEASGTTYLVVGSDSRKGLTEQQQKDLKTGKDLGGRGRTDTILLLHIGSGSPLLISIPRDSLLPIPGYGTTKVNAAYAFGGPPLLVSTLEDATGLRIDHYVEIGFGGVVNMVDAVGGVKICPKQDIDDKLAGLHVKEGCQEADGKTALAYARARHAYANGDLQRVQSQREVIGGIGAKVKSPITILDPVRYYQVITGGASTVTIDSDAGLTDMARFALALSSAMGDKGRNCTVPISDMAVHWDTERAKTLFDHLRTGDSVDVGTICTKDGLPEVQG